MLKKYITWYALSLHCLWGVLLLFWPTPMFATPIHTFAHAIGGNQFVVALAFLMVASLALVGLWLDRGPIERHDILVIGLLIPQQIVLLINAGGGIWAASQSAYADGVNRHFAFIFADQLPMILAALIYSLAILEHYGRGRRVRTGQSILTG